MNKLPISKKIKATATALLLAAAMAIPSPAMPINAAEIVNMSLTPSYAASTSLKLSKSKATLYTKNTLKLTLGKVAAKNIIWVSSNPKVAKVNSKGVVTAVKKGKAVITAVYKGKSYNCTVTVKNPSLNTTAETLKIDNTLQLKVTGATATSFTSSDTKVAKVSSKGLVTALSAGTATIKVACDNGNTYKCVVNVPEKASMDLGGMEIIIRDWWSSGDTYEPTNEYEEAQKEWIDYIQDTYNFTIKRQAISDWGNVPADFVDYTTTGGDDNNYVFVLRNDPAVSSAMQNGLMYDLATIPYLDFSESKFTRNKVHETYSLRNSIYAMSTDEPEARTGVFFNKQILRDAGIDPESLYDMQAEGTWTWDKFDELCSIVQRDMDGDGTDDIYGLTLNEGVMTTAAVFSNNGSYVGMDANGYVYNLESPETLQALEWVVDMFSKYDDHDPEGVQWDYYRDEFLSGTVAFMIDDAYCGMDYGFLEDATFDIGFVMFPMGPRATTCVNCWSNNPVVIPNCYDIERAEKIAFAYNLYTQIPKGYEKYKDLSSYENGIFDSRAINETINMMTDPAHGIIEYHSLIPNINIGPDLTWSVYAGTNEDGGIAGIIDNIRDYWKDNIDQANW